MKANRWALVAWFAMSLMLWGATAHAGSGTLKGTFKYKDPATGIEQMLNSGFIYLHSASKPPPMEKFFSKADYILGPTSNGLFSVAVPEGNYYIRILRRQVVGATSRPYGPPEEGDLTWFQTAPITIAAGATVDLGVKYANPFRVAPVTITGVVTSQTGAPVAGYYVRAQTEPCQSGGYDYGSNQCGPDKFVALQPTDASGKYTLYLKDAGTYYLYASPCLSTDYSEYTGNRCNATPGPNPLTLSLGQTRTVNVRVWR